MSGVSDLLTERDGPVLRLTINREDKRNALSADVMRGLLDGVTAAFVTNVPGPQGDRVGAAAALPEVMA